MGSFYTNITVIGGSADRVAAELRDLRRRAYLADFNGTCVVYDQECEKQDTQVLAALAEHLATRLAARCFAALNHDDDILWFQLYDGPDLVAEYANRGGPKTNVTALCRALGKPGSVVHAWFLLHLPFLFQVTRHLRLARLLGLPEASVGSGYTYISRGEMPVGVEKGRLVQI
jgi:hypothetical protein